MARQLTLEERQVVVIGEDDVRFTGALMPQVDTLRRALQATVIDAKVSTRWLAVAAEIKTFAQRQRDCDCDCDCDRVRTR